MIQSRSKSHLLANDKPGLESTNDPMEVMNHRREKQCIRSEFGAVDSGEAKGWHPFCDGRSSIET